MLLKDSLTAQDAAARETLARVEAEHEAVFARWEAAEARAAELEAIGQD